MIDLLGHVAYLFLMTGTYLVGRNNGIGWGVRAVGDVVWMGLGVAMGLSSIWLWSGVFLMIDISAWSKWRRAKLEARS